MSVSIWESMPCCSGDDVSHSLSGKTGSVEMCDVVEAGNVDSFEATVDLQEEKTSKQMMLHMDRVNKLALTFMAYIL
ncbi:hypothetical protein [Paenibacillus psychroresistens]|uniref:hypothetical protein n=1 Tax=Paenibacillus psychroresistens TaxID=1778678 RepID=UPI001D04CCC3|nr:hypothetical protein [Paenibacillus psychroresistens]